MPGPPRQSRDSRHRIFRPHRQNHDLSLRHQSGVVGGEPQPMRLRQFHCLATRRQQQIPLPRRQQRLDHDLAEMPHAQNANDHAALPTALSVPALRSQAAGG